MLKSETIRLARTEAATNIFTELSDTPQARAGNEDLALISFRTIAFAPAARQPTISFKQQRLTTTFYFNIFLSDGPGVLSFVFFFVSLRVLGNGRLTLLPYYSYYHQSRHSVYVWSKLESRLKL